MKDKAPTESPVPASNEPTTLARSSGAATVRPASFLNLPPAILRALAFGLFVLVLPFLPWASTHRDEITVIGFFSILAVGLTLVMGYAGQLVLSQAAFYGVGAYTSGVLSVNLKWPPLLGIGVGVIVAALLGWVSARLLFRLQGTSLALASLGLGIIVITVIGQWDEVTRGQQSLTGIPKLDVLGFTFKDDLAYYYLVWATVLTVMLLSFNIINSRVGRAFRALRGSEVAAGTLGINTTSFKVQVFVLAAAFAGLAGGLYAHYRSVLSPGTFNWSVSVEIVVMVAIGGVASIWGAPFGAAAVLIITPILRGFFSGTSLAGGGLENIIYGLALVVIMIFLPSGLLSGTGGWWPRLFGRFRPSHPHNLPPEESSSEPVSGAKQVG